MRKTLALLFLLPLAGCAADEAKKPEPTPADSSSTTTGKSDPAPISKGNGYSEPTTPAPVTSAPASKPVTIPVGTKLTVILADPLSSGKNKAGDKFTANLAEAIIIDGKTVLAKGAQVQGKVVSAEDSGRVKGLANMGIALTGVTVGKQPVTLSTAVINQEAEPTKGKDATIVGGAAAVGTAIGAIAGGKKGAATGAAVGGGAGVGTVLATKGKEVEYPTETKLTFATDKAFTVTP